MKNSIDTLTMSIGPQVDTPAGLGHSSAVAADKV